MGSIFGIAKRGFGMLKKGSKPKIKEQLKVFKQASEKNKIRQINKKTMRTLGEEVEKFRKTSEKALKKPYSDSAVNKYLTKEYKKTQRKP